MSCKQHSRRQCPASSVMGAIGTQDDARESSNARTIGLKTDCLLDSARTQDYGWSLKGGRSKMIVRFMPRKQSVDHVRCSGLTDALLETF